jgi:class I fructose-bisphosphate aldolase
MNPRLNRLFAHDGRCVNVAVDHGLFNEPAFLDGIREMGRLVSALVDARPDAIQLTVGQAHLLQGRAGAKPALVLRTDVANVYGRALPAVLFSEVGPEVVEQAVSLDAACVVVNLLLLPDRPDVHHACVRIVVRLKAVCERFQMPLMVEPLVMRPNHEAGGYQVDGDTEKIAALVRQAVELGADVIKADPTDQTDDYVEIVRVAGDCPVLVRGGGRAELEVVLRRVQAFLDQGAAGIVFGRNVFQHEQPGRVAQVLSDLVHARIDVDSAIESLRVPAPAGG